MKRYSLSFCLVIVCGFILTACSTTIPTTPQEPSLTAVRVTDMPTPLAQIDPTPTLSRAKIRVTSTPRPAHSAAPENTLTATQEKPLETTLSALFTELAQTRTAFARTPNHAPTATFDIHHILKSTRAKAQCPQIKQHPVPVPTLDDNYQFFVTLEDPAHYLDYLNQYGPAALFQADSTTTDSMGDPWSHFMNYQDFTNDGVPEVVMSLGHLYIFGCQDGEYQTLFKDGLV